MPTPPDHQRLEEEIKEVVIYCNYYLPEKDEDFPEYFYCTKDIDLNENPQDTGYQNPKDITEKEENKKYIKDYTEI